MKIVITGAAGQISYSLIPFLCEKGVFNSSSKIDLNLVEIPQAMQKLEGVVKELEDSAYSNVNKILTFDDISLAVEDADWCLLVGSIPRGIVFKGKEIKERADLYDAKGSKRLVNYFLKKFKKVELRAFKNTDKYFLLSLIHI